MGLCSVAFLIMLALKLAGITDISWWLVFAPFAVDLFILAVLFVMAFVFGVKIKIRGNHDH